MIDNILYHYLSENIQTIDDYLHVKKQTLQLSIIA